MMINLTNLFRISIKLSIRDSNTISMAIGEKREQNSIKLMRLKEKLIYLVRIYSELWKVTISKHPTTGRDIVR